MKKTLSILLLFLMLISGCRKTHSPNYLLFDFDLNNSYTIESTFDTTLTNKGLLTYSTLTPSASIWLIDGEVTDTLTTCCGAWNYVTNPSSKVKIWFPNSTINDGIYEYHTDSLTNDFYIDIMNDMKFQPNVLGDTVFLNEWTLVSISRPNSQNPNQVIDAKLKIENSSTENTTVKFIVNTAIGETIKGSYNGNLKEFTFISCDGDCD
jgi:hypothetical protein